MDDECGSDGSFSIPGSRPKVAAKKSSTEFGENSEVKTKRVKLRDLDSVLRPEEIDTHSPKPLDRNERYHHSLSAENKNSEVMADSSTINLDIAQKGKLERAPIPIQGEHTPVFIDINTKLGAVKKLASGDTLAYVNNLSSSKKQGKEQGGNSVTARAFRWDLNADDASSTFKDPFHHYENFENIKRRDASECGSTTGPLEEKDSMRVWKEMKQNGFLSSNHGGIPVPKPRGRKSKNDGIKKKMELAKREQVDRFAKIAAPSGLLNELNPGIINHVRNSKQVHSIIEALVRSEKLENSHDGCKQRIQSKSTTKESSERKKGTENFSGSGMHQFNNFRGYGSLHSSLKSQDKRGCSMSTSESLYLNSEHTGEDADSSIVEKRVFSNSTCPSNFKLGSEDDILALKLSSSTAMASEITTSLSNAESADLMSVSSLSVRAANIASQWLELLHQDIKGRLAALRRSKKRVRAVIHTELPFLVTREFSYNQENDPYVMKTHDAGSRDNASVNEHRTRWGALFDQMDKALSEEERQLENWLNQVKEMQLHCEGGLQHFQYNPLHGLQPPGILDNDSRSERGDSLERELAVRAAAASIYSTCNFLMSMENPPCLG